jgi:hypothetical protein
LTENLDTYIIEITRFYSICHARHTALPEGKEKIVKNDDLTQLKHIESSRMKLLNNHGITTIKQLYEMPEEKLAGIKSIGSHNAKLIKDAAKEYYKTVPPKIVSDKERKMEDLERDLQKKIKRLQKALDRVNENLKPMGKKKFLELYIDLRKTSTRLKERLDDMKQNQKNLPKKLKKKIIKRADTLTLFLKKGGKTPKKKKYKEITAEIEAFSRMLRQSIS